MTPFNSALLMGMCCLSVCLAQLGMMMYLPGISAITQAMNTRSHLTSLSLPAYLVGMAVPMLIWGKWGAMFGLKKLLIVSLALFGLCSVLLAMCTQIEAFITLRLIQGIGASGMSVIARSLTAHYFKGPALAKALSWLSIAFVFSLGTGQYVGALLISAAGWSATFWVLGVGAILHIGWVYRYLPDSRQAHGIPSSWGHYVMIIRHLPFLFPALTGGVGYGIIMGFSTAAPSILQTTYHWSVNDYGALGWAVSLAYLLGSLSINRWVSTYGQKTLSRIATRIMLLASVLMLMGLMANRSCALLLWLPYCGIVFGQAMNYPISLSKACEYSPVSGPYSMALCGFIHQLLAAFIGTTVSLLTLRHPLPLALICLLLAVLVWGLNIVKPTSSRDD